MRRLHEEQDTNIIENFHENYNRLANLLRAPAGNRLINDLKYEVFYIMDIDNGFICS